jgi:hypothetical protein
MDTSVEDIAEANAERADVLEQDYDPVTGVGSPIERVPIRVRPGEVPLVPAGMKEAYPEVWAAARHYGSYVEAATHFGNSEAEAVEEFNTKRARHDFEFWASQAAYIEQGTEDREGGPVAPMVLNRAQRIYFKALHEQWAAGAPVRIILLKARQWGGSTLTQCFFAWIQLYHRSNWHSFICNLTLDQSRRIRGMYDLLAENHPEAFGDITLGRYEGSSNVKQIRETNSIVGVTSIENPDSPRSYTIHLAHLSEVGLWPSTPKVNAKDYAQAITGAVATEPGTAIVEESTARGVGTYFHNHWQDAGAGRSSYEQVFIAWHDIPKYRTPVEDATAAAQALLRPRRPEDGVPEHVETARRLWRLGATLGGIRWYLGKLADMKGDTAAMQNEYPSKPSEAFQSTGQRFFHPQLTARMREEAQPPIATGTLDAEGETGEKALQGVRFRPGDGDLKVWRRPTDKVWWNGTCITPAEGYVARRYCAYVDFGGKTEEADYSVITVGDRIKMLKGGPVETVARLRTHMRPDRFAWASARLAQFYDEALLIYEINRHRKDRGDEVRGFEPEWSLAVLEEVMGVYDNLYLRRVEDRVDEKERLTVGFHLNQSTKPLILNTLDAGLSEEPSGQTYIDPDARLVDEMEMFERKPDGRLGAVEGGYDDVVISAAGTAWGALKHMEAPAVQRPIRVDRPSPTPSQF